MQSWSNLCKPPRHNVNFEVELESEGEPVSNLLLVEANSLLNLTEQRHLREAFPDVRLFSARTGDEAKRIASHHPPDVVILGYPVSTGDTGDILANMVTVAPKSTYIVTGEAPSAETTERYKDRLYEIIEKPFEVEELVYVAGRALHASTSETSHEPYPKDETEAPPFDRHKVLNVLGGLLAGIRAFEADLEAEAERPEVVRETVTEYVPRLVEMVNRATSLIKK